MRNAIVMAAGKGTRMKSFQSKVMHPIIDRADVRIYHRCLAGGTSRTNRDRGRLPGPDDPRSISPIVSLPCRSRNWGRDMP